MQCRMHASMNVALAPHQYTTGTVAVKSYGCASAEPAQSQYSRSAVLCEYYDRNSSLPVGYQYSMGALTVQYQYQIVGVPGQNLHTVSTDQCAASAVSAPV